MSLAVADEGAVQGRAGFAHPVAGSVLRPSTVGGVGLVGAVLDAVGVADDDPVVVGRLGGQARDAALTSVGVEKFEPGGLASGSGAQGTLVP